MNGQTIDALTVATPCKALAAPTTPESVQGKALPASWVRELERRARVEAKRLNR